MQTKVNSVAIRATNATGTGKTSTLKIGDKIIVTVNSIFAHLAISLNLVLAGLRLDLKNRQVGEKWVSDNCSYLCKGLY
jgi:hypothetical protein